MQTILQVCKLCPSCVQNITPTVYLLAHSVSAHTQQLRSTTSKAPEPPEYTIGTNNRHDVVLFLNAPGYRYPIRGFR